MKLLLIAITCLGLATQSKSQNLFNRFFENRCNPRCPVNSQCKYSYLRNTYYCDCLEGYRKNRQGECVGGTSYFEATNLRGQHHYLCRNEHIDECRRYPYPCPSDAVCVNSLGSFSCQCRPGYEYIGNKCVDINECLTIPFLCPGNTCQNTPGSYRCGCPSGFELKRGICNDVNECRNSPCPANSVCSNTIGSFKCRCSNGFQLRKGKCIDINECNASYRCPSNSRCVNTEGSFKCQCKSGFQPKRGGCINVNECQRRPCARHATCTDTAGSYTCKCRSGYFGDGKKNCRLIRVLPKPKTTKPPTITTRPPTTTPNLDLCYGLPRNWSKCMGSPPIRFTVDSCTFKFENCSDGTILGRLFVDNFLGPNVDQGGSAEGDSAGERNLNLFGVISTTPSPTNSSCQIQPVYNSKGELFTGVCLKNKKRSKRSAAPQITQTKRDLLIMLDESGSVGAERYEKVKRIAAAIVRLLCERIKVNPSYTRVAITSFNRRVYFHVKLKSIYNLRYLDEDAERLAQFIFTNIYYHGGYNAGRTCLVQALDHAYSETLSPQNGGRRGDPYVEQDIILISDGCENCVPEYRRPAEIERLTSFFIQQGIHVYVIGVGLKRACRETLALLAQGGRCFHFFYLSNWDYDLDGFIDQLEHPPQGICLNVFENSNGQCLPPI